MDRRFVELKTWLNGKLPEFVGFDRDEWQLLPVSGDASFRRYFRAVSGEHSWIAVDAPPEKEDSRPFVAVAAALEQLGVLVPHVYLADHDLGFMLLSDLGDDLYLPQLNSENVDELYSYAMKEILRMQSYEEGLDLPSYNEALLLREMKLFPEWFLTQLLGISLEEKDTQILESFFSCLIRSAMEQPTAFVHRDYHSRNLMYQGMRLPGVIDFQDAVLGPVTYDLVSLLRDCYIEWPDEQVYQWVESFRLQLMGEEGRSEPDAEQFKRWFDLMGAQRHLKAVGIFARLNIRDGKSGYLQDIPRTFAYILRAAEKTDELTELAGWLRNFVVPKMYDADIWPSAELDHWMAP